MNQTVRCAGVVLAAVWLMGLAAVCPAHETADRVEGGTPLRLTEQERQWLAEHRDSIRFAPDLDYAPISFVNEQGRYTGLAADHLRLIEQRLGVHFQPVRCESWADALDKAKRREVDLFAVIQDTPQRRQFLRFTKPYVTIPNAILVRRGTAEHVTLEQLAGKKVAVVAGYATCDYLKDHFLRIELVPVKDNVAGLQMLSFGQVDAMVSDLAVASYHIDRMGISNLGVAGTIDYSWHFSLACRSDWPILQGILDKALASISAEQRQAIHRKWIPSAPNRPWWTQPATKWALGAVGLAVLGFILWIVALRRQVRLRTGQLRQELVDRRQAEKYLSSIFRVAPVGIGVVVNRHFVQVNDKLCEMLGYEAEELLNQSSRMIYPTPEDYDYVSKVKYEQIRNHGTGTVETRFRRKDGEVRDVLLASTPINAEDLSRGVAFTALDITESKRAEQALRESEAKFKLMSEQSMLAVGILQEGRFQYVNQVWQRITGYSVERILAWAPEEYAKLIHPDDYDFVMAQAHKKQVGDDSYVVHYTWRVVRADGQVRWVEIYSKTIEYLGRPADFITMIDITERKQAEQRMQMMQFSIDHASDAIYWIDAQGRFIYVNDVACENLGYSRSALLSMSVPDIDPLFSAEVWPRHWQELRNRGAMTFQSVHRARDGREFPVEIMANYLEYEGRQYNFAFARDITERKRAEERERRQHELVEAELAKAKDALVRQTRLATIGQVAASIAHELRNPLGAVRNAAFFLKRRGTADPVKWAEYLRIIDREVNAAEHIISNLLEMTRAKEPYRRPVQLAELVRRAFDRVRTGVAVTLKMQCRPEDLVVMADPDQLGQVLDNLMTNAIQAMAERGTIHIDAAVNGAMVRLYLRDDGPGVAPADREQIFEPLYTTRAKGTGLGLAICRQIIERHNGRIYLVDPPAGQRGAVFCVELPVDPPRSIAADREPA